MKYFKYCMILLMWFLAKPLSILLGLLITWGWMMLLGINTWWSYLLAFSPTIILYTLIIVYWIKDRFNDTQNHVGDLAEDVMILFAILMIIPCIGISVLIASYGCMGIGFPNKYDFEELEKSGIIKTFISMQGRFNEL